MPKHLLVADDSITIQKVVSITFAGEDFRITGVDNGDDALARARELKPDIILADVVMPRKNGYEVCEAIKADPALRRIPVLLLAGTFEAFDEARARAVHADAHIAKPFESQALLTKVKELLERPAQPAAAAPAAAPAAKPAAPPPGVAVAGARPPPARPPPGAPPPGRPPGAAPPVARPLAQPAAIARPPGAPPIARPMTAPPSARPPPAGPPPGAPPRASAPRPPAGPPPAVRPAPTMPAAPPAAAPPTAARARNPFGLDDAPAAPAAPLAVANARVVELEELDFEPAVEAPEPAPAAQAIDLPEMRLDEELELAPATEFIPHAASTGHAPESAAPAMELDLEPLAAPAAAPSVASAPNAPAGDAGEAQLRQALSQASREVIERIAWEVVPELAETIIREQLDRLVKERQR